MMKNGLVVLMFVLGLFPVSGNTATEASKRMTRDAMLAQRKAVVAVNMDLSENEEKDFWPIYDNYQIELNKLNAEIQAIVMKFAINQKDITESLAKELMNRALKAERDRLDLKRATCTGIQEKLGSKVAARFYQIENKIESTVRADSSIPLMK